jgi:hypothetical protein
MSIVSQKLRDSAGHHDARCFLNIEGVCPDETESKTAGCMLCHVRLPGDVGGAQKPDDTCATFGCGPCHRKFDANGCDPLPYEDWLYYAIRGMKRTTRWWYQHGFLTIKGAK